MAGKEVVAPVAATDRETLEDLARSMRDIAQEGRDKFKQVSILDAVHTTPWNPTGAKTRATLKRESYQNGAALKEEMMTDEEITLYNKLKPGRYANKRYEVAKVKNGGINLRYPMKTADHRMKIARDAGHEGLTGILKLILTEQEATAARRRSGITDDDE